MTLLTRRGKRFRTSMPSQRVSTPTTRRATMKNPLISTSTWGLSYLTIRRPLWKSITTTKAGTPSSSTPARPRQALMRLRQWRAETPMTGKPTPTAGQTLQLRTLRHGLMA
ncbi:MAG: hypothetical protein IJ520_07710 [Synergistaceae bacterium]|nr:hypothetical protein [Synergistaceae bacterium]